MSKCLADHRPFPSIITILWLWPEISWTCHKGANRRCPAGDLTWAVVLCHEEIACHIRVQAGEERPEASFPEKGRCTARGPQVLERRIQTGVSHSGYSKESSLQCSWARGKGFVLGVESRISPACGFLLCSCALGNN